MRHYLRIQRRLGDQPGAADRFQPVALAPAPPPQHLHQWLVPHYDVPTDVGTPWGLVDWDGTNQETVVFILDSSDVIRACCTANGTRGANECREEKQKIALHQMGLGQCYSEKQQVRMCMKRSPLLSNKKHEQLHFQNIERSDLVHQIPAKDSSIPYVTQYHHSKNQKANKMKERPICPKTIAMDRNNIHLPEQQEAGLQTVYVKLVNANS
ncbi:hypothetical protein MUK42_29452 [Musa troglodytarum]|uniref:Uncharacterized protein n=1 Tax=Musa troglodytarum TaxID=320322 RepID=A0A9E7JVB1_9LILI|nr:hypothetical protein MUK42_29452 [Musa troglodytarum]